MKVQAGKFVGRVERNETGLIRRTICPIWQHANDSSSPNHDPLASPRQTDCGIITCTDDPAQPPDTPDAPQPRPDAPPEVGILPVAIVINMLRT